MHEAIGGYCCLVRLMSCVDGLRCRVQRGLSGCWDLGSGQQRRCLRVSDVGVLLLKISDMMRESHFGLHLLWVFRLRRRLNLRCIVVRQSLECAVRVVQRGHSVDVAFFRQRHVRGRLGLHVTDLRLAVLRRELSGLLLRLGLLLLVFLHALEDHVLVAQPRGSDQNVTWDQSGLHRSC